MYGKSCANVKVKPRSALTFIRGASFIYGRKFYAHTQPKVMRQWKFTFSCLF